MEVYIRLHKRFKCLCLTGCSRCRSWQSKTSWCFCSTSKVEVHSGMVKEKKKKQEHATNSVLTNI